MASRRMFSKDVVCSDRFLDMPASAQALYFQYGLEADDDGFVSAPKKILRLTNASDDDLKILVAKGFLIPFDSGVVVIRDWKINNYLRRDRYTPSNRQGAVIPPNKEFMAVLGDQKSGNNIEAPESLIRRIVREESGNGKGSTYNVTAQVNRRTLFDLVLEEGKVRRTVTGRNPFETV